MIKKRKNSFWKLRFYNYIIIILGTLLLHSCSTSSEMETEEKQSNAILLSPSELKSKVNEQSLKMTSLDCEGDINIDSPELNSSGSITISICKPDSIYSKLEGPFGISIANFLITRNNFIYYNIRENTVIKGSSSPLNLGAILKLKLDFNDLIYGYSCSYYFPDTSSINSDVSYDKNLYLLKIMENEQTKKLWINPKFFYIEKYELLDKTGNSKLKIEYTDFNLEKNIYFPNNVYITNPIEKQNLWISYGKKVFNNNKLKFRLKIPKSAKVINWE